MNPPARPSRSSSIGGLQRSNASSFGDLVSASQIAANHITVLLRDARILVFCFPPGLKSTRRHRSPPSARLLRHEGAPMLATIILLMQFLISAKAGLVNYVEGQANV